LGVFSLSAEILSANILYLHSSTLLAFFTILAIHYKSLQQILQVLFKNLFLFLIITKLFFRQINLHFTGLLRQHLILTISASRKSKIFRKYSVFFIVNISQLI